jgi:hypothetical protein
VPESRALIDDEYADVFDHHSPRSCIGTERAGPEEPGAMS